MEKKKKKRLKKKRNNGKADYPCPCPNYNSKRTGPLHYFKPNTKFGLPDAYPYLLPGMDPKDYQRPIFSSSSSSSSFLKIK